MLLDHPTYNAVGKFTRGTMEFYSISIKQNLFHIKLNVLLPISGKIQILSSARQISLVTSKQMNAVGILLLLIALGVEKQYSS